ncbi:MAG: transglycosylase SLT domain-containing protein [Thiomargarita sp.]|nr:transglycosylase SLT domain-containing protein [Thiomargarita sp.]
MMRYLLFSLFMMMCVNSHANTQQRWQFDAAYQALQDNNIADFKKFSRGLQNYSLYYYLRYQYLKPRLSTVSSSEIRTFLKRYGQTYFGDSLRRHWLSVLANKKHWNTFLQVYTPQTSTHLRCHYVYARLMTQRYKKTALKEAKQLWLVGKSQPESCTPVFQYLEKHTLLTHSLVWDRIKLSMSNGKLSLVNYLAKRLGKTDQAWVALWHDMHHKPEKTLTHFNKRNISIVRDIILHGIRRLARQDFLQAKSHWKTLQQRYHFSTQQKGEMKRDLALASVRAKHPKALQWLKAIQKKYLTDKVNITRLKMALKKKQWKNILTFIKALSPKEQNTFQWRYWKARALEKTRKKTQAQKIYKKLAKERDYYGFLAADRMGTPYKMQYHPITLTQTQKKQLLKNPSIAAAQEFYETKQLPNARREWRYALKHLSISQKAQAAVLASQWGWHDQAITAAAKARHYDDLKVRFPLPYRQQLTAESKLQNVYLPWVYAIIRQETAFWSTARSPVGALGLMQLMPATGKLVAKKLGVTLNTTQDILKIEINIKLGIAYLQQMLTRFKGNYMLASAAYNAGPGRSKRWAAENDCLPADIWVELIQFNETRKYVRSVLFYTRIFEYRLKQKTHPLRMTPIRSDQCL